MKLLVYRSLFFLAVLVLFTISCQLLTLLTYHSPCGQSVLSLAERNFEIKPAKAGYSALPKIQQDTSNTAYWVKGTTTRYVFLLSPTTENLLLGYVLKGGEPARIAWANCDSASFILEAPRQETLDVPALLDQSSSGISVVIQGDPAAAAWVIQGELAGEEIQAVSTPKPEDVLAEISLLGTELSQDGTLLKVSVSVVNYGQKSLTVTSGDVSLLADGVTTMPLGSEPALPREIVPGATETFSFTFARPAASEATLRIFDAEYLFTN